ncbi:MAG: hypothetical protein H6Q05_2764 [Acidobacteria bacterium]|jgi:hypothetical protein|nr:hypothetical protein [Acidobacteriota bacterium]
MRKSLEDGTARYEILGMNDSILKFSDISAALRFLRTLAGNPTHMEALRGLVSEVSMDVHRMDAEGILGRAAELLVSGRIRILRSHQFSGGTAAEALAAQKSEAEAKAPAPAAPPKKHWIEFKVVDDLTGEPVQGLELTIKLPDGGVEKRTTDAGGFVEVVDILKGDCEISVDPGDTGNTAAYEFVRTE